MNLILKYYIFSTLLFYQISMNAPLAMVVVLKHVRIHLAATIVLVVVDTVEEENCVMVSGDNV